MTPEDIITQTAIRVFARLRTDRIYSATPHKELAEMAWQSGHALFLTRERLDGNVEELQKPRLVKQEEEAK